MKHAYGESASIDHCTHVSVLVADAHTRTHLFEVIPKEPCSLHVDTHGSKHNGKVVIVGVKDVLLGHKGCLPADLSCYLRICVCVCVYMCVTANMGPEQAQDLSANERLDNEGVTRSRLILSYSTLASEDALALDRTISTKINCCNAAATHPKCI